MPLRCGLLLSFAFTNSDRPRSLASYSLWLNRPLKQLITQPDAIGVDDVGLAVIGDFLDPALAEKAMHLTAVDAAGLARKSHDLAKLMKRDFPLRTVGRKYITKVHRVIAVTVEIMAGPKALDPICR